MKKTVSIVTILLFVSGCASMRPINQAKELTEIQIEDNTPLDKGIDIDMEFDRLSSIENAENYKFEEYEIAVDDEKEENAETKIQKVTASESAPERKKYPGFNLDYEKGHYDFWIKYFTEKDKDRFLRHLQNGEKVHTVVEEVLEKHGMPKELYYVGMIESGYNFNIKSRANAVGPWQFIKGTATRYGLRVNRYVDERRSIYKATEAAANYFKDLYNIFGSWELALCAYNAGEYGIIRAIRKGNTRDYKTLVRKKLIPRETIYYIPKIAAAMELSHRWGKGIDQGESQFFLKAKEVSFTGGINVKTLAKKMNVSYDSLKKLNPDIRGQWLKSGRGPIKFFVPTHDYEKVSAYLQKNSKSIKRSVAQSTATKTKVKTYRVRPGDNLTSLANRFGVHIRKLKEWNNLRSSMIKIGQKLKVHHSGKQYVVRRGDNLHKIAQRFNTSIAQIVQVNSLKSKTIYPRQRIFIPES